MNRRLILKLAIFSFLPIGLSQHAHAEEFPINSNDVNAVPKQFRRKTVNYLGNHAPGTIVVDTHRKYLYLVQANAKAIRYGIGVGKQGFGWSGGAVIRRKAKWPTWTPPAEMVERDPLAAEWAGGIPGGPKNPLGARALYLYQGKVDNLYRIHGTFVPSSIGKAVSSGCIRLINADIVDLFNRVPTGTRVIVLQNAPRLDNEGRSGPRKRKGLFSLFERS